MILIDYLINDSIFYCACVIVRISDDFYDDRYENRLVEIRLNPSKLPYRHSSEARGRACDAQHDHNFLIYFFQCQFTTIYNFLSEPFI